MLERGDFDSDRKYDDYLEMLSDIGKYINHMLLYILC